MEPGNVVRVPLGPRTALGVVWDRDETASEVDESKLKAITQVLSARPIPDFHRKFVDWVARYTLSAPGAVLRMTLSAPDGLLPPTAERWVRLAPDQSPPQSYRATPARAKVLALLGDSPESALRRQAAIQHSGVSPLSLIHI